MLKPDDVVRTPSGRLVCIDALRPDGKREAHYVHSGEPLVLDPALPGLYVVHVALPRPWKERTP